MIPMVTLVTKTQENGFENERYSRAERKTKSQPVM